MTESDLAYLKSRVDQLVGIETTDGEHLIAKIISVFDREDNPDLFYELVSTTNPATYGGKTGGFYSLPLNEINTVKAAS
jgi:hypothetical protein